jgi:flagellar FliL protein
MAEQQDDVAVTEEASGGKSKMMIIIAVVVLAIAGAGAFLFLGSGDKASEGPATEEAVVEAVSVRKAAIYYSLKKPLTVNFGKQSNGAVRYLSIKLKVMAREQTTIDTFKLHTPAVQHQLLMFLFGQKYDDLNTSAGKKELKRQALLTINDVLKSQQNPVEIDAVYITSLIMQ